MKTNKIDNNEFYFDSDSLNARIVVSVDLWEACKDSFPDEPYFSESDVSLSSEADDTIELKIESLPESEQCQILKQAENVFDDLAGEEFVQYCVMKAENMRDSYEDR